LRLLHFLAWIVGGAIVFGLVVLAIEPVCSQQLSTWWKSFLCESKISDFAIAYLIYCLAIVVAFRACGQARETRILHRAYVSVVPRGLAPFVSENGMLSCDVAFYNGGNLPARKLRWFIDRKFSTDAHLDDFPIGGNFSGSNIVPAQAEVRRGAKAIGAAELDAFKKGGGTKDRWLYVWGRVSYDDGFGRDRYTDFCFRYNLAGAKEGKIAAESARQHEHGNRTDEE
jgi:hypothetical protein